jgi:5-histidylcysteine sulfoxide synthase
LDLTHTVLFPRSPDLQGGDADAMRAALRDYFHATFSRYEQLFETLACDAAYFEKSISLRHPLIFYFGHTATFFINKLLLAGLVSERINPRFESMFAVGVDEMSWDDLNDKHYPWPTVAEVQAYRDQVRAVVDAVIATAPLTLPIVWAHPWWTIIMGVEHERIHLETSSVLIRQQRLDWVRPHPDWVACTLTGEPPGNALVAVAAGTVRLGKDRADSSVYGWDNEYGEHVAEVAEFQASRYLVSNREFLDFVEDSGYTNDAWWDEEGLAWRQFAQAQQPSFWVRSAAGDWQLRLMAEVVAMPWDWPAEVNYHEAHAF